MPFTVSFLIAGTKGFNCLRSFLEELPRTDVIIETVSSYQAKGLQHDALADIVRLCRRSDIDFVRRSDLEPARYAGSRLIFVAGWQYLFREIDDRFVILHDSILPKLRGFNPTVTALICGHDRLGVTALRPETEADAGAIYGQEMFSVVYPMTVQEVYERLGSAYARLVHRLIGIAGEGKMTAVPQDHSQATYSLWRDEADYRIDWSKEAGELVRFVDAVGWPYLGAQTNYAGREIRIDRAEISGERIFALRQPGKIWSIGPDGLSAEVVCGRGMMRIESARDADGNPVHFNTLRQRLS